MGVYYRTGQRSAVGVPWWIYLFFVLPLQVAYLFLKAFVYGCVVAGAFAIATGRAAHGYWQRRRRGA